MTINEFKEEMNEMIKYDNIKFKYEYYTRDTFFSMLGMNAYRNTKHIVPSKKFEVIDNKLYVNCYVGSRSIKLKNLVKRYPADLETIFICKDIELKLNTSGSALNKSDYWDCELREI